MDTATLQQTVEQMSEEMSLPRGFLEGLLKEDDWSFVIKAHAFLEAVLTNVLIEAFQWPELKNLLVRLDMSDVRIGKVKFAVAIGIIKKDGERFLRELSKLRNDLVHDIRNLGFNFKEHLSGLDRNQEKAFVDSLSYFASDEDLKERYKLSETSCLIIRRGLSG